MKNLITIRRPIIIFPIIFAFFSMINLYIKNFKLINVSELVVPGIVIFVLYTGIWWVSHRITGNRSKTAIITSIFFILFFSFGHFLSAFTSLLLRLTGIDLHPFVFNNISWKMIVLLVVWVGVFFIFAYSVNHINSDVRIIILFMNVTSITLLVVMVYQTTRETINTQKFVREGIKESNQVSRNSQSSSIQQAEPPDNPLPDIYYLIIDGYGNANTLNRYYGYDNNEFLTFLENKGFYTSTYSHSNYPHTLLSLSSSLNMEYLDEVAEIVGKSSINPLPLIQKIQSNRIIVFLDNHNYATVAYESGYGATELRSADYYFAPEQTLTAFQSELINLTPLWIWLRNVQFESQRQRILFIFDQLPSASRSNQPTFVFAHVTSPHPPFVFGPNGEKDNPDMAYSTMDANYFTDIAGQEEYVQRYRNQVIYLNTLMEKMIGYLWLIQALIILTITFQ